MKTEAGHSSRKNKLRIFNIISYSLLFLYLLSYSILSLFGSYSVHPTASGKIKYEFGLSVPDVLEWEPRYIVRHNYGFNTLGVFFMPLVDLDRKFWHKPINFFHEGLKS